MFSLPFGIFLEFYYNYLGIPNLADSMAKNIFLQVYLMADVRIITLL